MKIIHTIPRLLISASVFALALDLCAQAITPYDFLWTSHNGGTGSIDAFAATADRDSSVWITGEFSGSNTFGGTTLRNLATNIWDFFLAKYDASGQPVWATQGFSSAGEAWGFAIDVDPTGSVFVGGQFQNTMQLGTNTLVGTAYNNAFLAKYDVAGNLLWVHKLGSNSKTLGRLAVDRLGNVYFTTRNRGTESFGGVSVSSHGDADACVIKMDNGGNVLWARNGGGANDDAARGVAVDAQGNVYVCGDCVGATTWGSTNVSGYGDWDVFLAKYDSTGAFQWVRVYGGSGHDEGTRLAVDSSGNVYLTGYFSSTATFGSQVYTSHGNRDGFLARHDPNGNLVWFRQFGGAGRDGGWGLKMNSEDILLLSGEITGPASIGNVGFPGYGGMDMFVAAYDLSGGLRWVRFAGSTANETGNDVAACGVAAAYVVGQFSAMATFGATQLVPEGGSDLYVTKLADLHRIRPRLGIRVSSAAPVLSLIGAEGSRVRVEYTDRLTRSNNWSVLTNFTLPASLYEFADPSAANLPMRLYRAAAQ